MPNYAYVCLNDECLEEFDELGPYEDRENPRSCPVCSAEARYKLSAPMVMRKSTPDGQRRKSDKEWQKIRTVSKLKVQKARASNHEEKARILKEIDKVTGKKRIPKKRIVDTF